MVAAQTRVDGIMKQNSTNASDNASLDSLESDLFGMMISFPRKVTLLIEQAELGGEGTMAATEKINQILDNITAEMTQTKDFDIKKQLDAAYEEMRRFLHGLAKPQGAVNPTDEAARIGS
jgi:hypothetical protein